MLLSDRANILAVIRADLLAVREEFAVPRRTEIGDGDFELEDEDLIPREDMVVTVTHGGYVKRVALNAYRTQHRGGKGKSGMTMKDEDAIVGVFSASTHTPVLFFATNGKAYKLKTWRLPLGGPTSRGKAFVNLLPTGAITTSCSLPARGMCGVTSSATSPRSTGPARSP